MNQEFDKVKKLLLKPFKAKAVQQPTQQPGPQPTPSTSARPSVLQQTVHTTGLQPKYLIPPLPHPCPYERLSILASPSGLLLRPYSHDGAGPESHVHIAWGKEGKVTEVQHDGGGGIDWTGSVVAYGIVGTLSLFTAAYLLVISSRADVGCFLDEQHAVYSVKGVTVIPLTENRAKAALSVLARFQTSATHRTLNVRAANSSEVADPPTALGGDLESSTASLPRVAFIAEDLSKTAASTVVDRFDPPDDGHDDSLSSTPASADSSPPSEDPVNSGNVAKVLADKLSFWSRLSKRPLSPTLETPSAQQDEFQRELSVSLDEMIQGGNHAPSEVIEGILSATAPPPATIEEKHNELEDKIIRDCVREFTRGTMFFAYAFDITRSLQHKQELTVRAKKKHALLADLNALEDWQTLSPPGDKIDVLAEPGSTLPLWRRVDRQFWWNEWLSKPFIDAGLHSYILPVMQGFYQIASFSVPREPVASEEGDYAIADYIVISRRSRDRAGLRYQRRGIDDDAHVANFVETETIMRVERESFSNVFSHVQIRGSIPLFWSQHGYGLKPAPALSTDRNQAQNLNAMKRHFTRTLHHYGPHTIVNLAEQSGKEAIVTNAYEQYVESLDNRDVQYCKYDFHKETRGMKYENIVHLIDKMERTFESQGFFWVSNDTVLSYQKGVFRVNCIDCLDRTNVVESAFARYVLNRQLGAIALFNHETEKTEIDVVFNDVWANNGDAVSRAYAGTSALKGDFTRTGKRDLTGMLNDGVNSLARMYTSTFGDWFNQAVIDFMLGNRTISVFSEFLLKLQSTDPSDLVRISRIRAEAIATSVARVLVDGERLLSGWTLFAPADVNTKVGGFEEKVLLLSARALYIVSYDYTLEKVKMYTRVPLGDIVSITRGAYILSPLEEASRDPAQNAGFIVTWRNTNQDTRVTSYSIRNNLDSPPTSPGNPQSSPFPRAPTSLRLSRTPIRRDTPLSRILSIAAAPVLNNEVTFAAFKALPIDPARSRRESGSFVEPADELTGAKDCKEAVDFMVDAIQKACADVGNTHPGFIKEADIVSLAEAQRTTSVYSKMEYGVKRLLWLGS